MMDIAFTQAKTIQIFLPDGDPRGIRVAEITTRIVRVIEVPRDLLAQFLLMPEAAQVGLYFLFGTDLEDESIQRIYIGQTGGVGDRLSQHHKEKVFWNKALIVVSLTNSLTQTHALFLEWISILEAKKIGRYTIMNGNGGNRPHTPAPLQADCVEIYETARTLLATLGHPVFEPVVRAQAKLTRQEFFYCAGSEAKGKGMLTDEGFVVLAGSSGRLENVPSIRGTADERFRNRLISEGILVPENGRLLVAKDHLFSSPSTAALALMGRTANGWLEWRTSEGKTLREAKQLNSD
jgi:hypothetical protein